MFRDKQHLRIPGPTPVPPGALSASARPMINHRGDEFRKLLEEVTRGLQGVFQTRNDVLILTTSGTGGLEAAVSNLLSPGEKALVASCGAFGDRVADIARAYGVDVVKSEVEWGRASEPGDVDRLLSQSPDIKVVFVTHNETSTGVENDVKALASVARAHDALVVVDAVSSLGSVNLETDAWGVDVVVTASQKGLMTPPGLAFVSVSERAWEKVASARCPRFYFDLVKARTFAQRWENPFTPAVSLLQALRDALSAIEAEGLAAVFARHARVASAVRAGIKALGLGLLAGDECASKTVTAVTPPGGIDADEFRKLLKSNYGVILAGGQGKLKGKIFRIAHMGYMDELDMVAAMAALEMGLARKGYPVKLGSGVAALEEVLMR
ncbi:MAG: alanine--glyoxylate aminotransferase family protein [Firmicutes bacterium]|nr:alanine--glyoxylate aminotransferase family protein [Bacillota bacterium]